MELEEFQKIWNKQEYDSKSEEELLALIHQKSRKPLSRIYRNMFLEILILVVVVLGLFFYFTSQNLSFPTLIMAAFVLGTAVLYWIFYRKTKIDLSHDNFSQTILKLDRLFSVYRVYLEICKYATPVGYLTGYFMAFFQQPNQEFDKGFWIGLALIIPVSLLVYFPVLWLARKFYGQHVDELKEMVREIKGLERNG